jgi:serine/threonine-protein kinase HipA
LINRATARPAADRLGFIRMLIFHYLVGNADAHGKNYALLYRNTTPDLSPLYDAVCTAAYPRLAKKLAMKIGDRNIPDTIQWAQWKTIVPDTRAAQRLLAKDMIGLAGAIRVEADSLIAELKETGIHHAILKTVRSIVETRATHLLRITENV